MKIATGGFPKAITKISIKINTNRILPNPFREQKRPKITSRKAYPGRNFFRSFSVPSSKLPPGGPRTPKIIKNRKKTQFLNHFFHASLHLLQHAFCLARRIHSERHCKYSRLDLCLPSLGKVKIVTQYPQIAWAGCLGVRR